MVKDEKLVLPFNNIDVPCLILQTDTPYFTVTNVNNAFRKKFKNDTSATIQKSLFKIQPFCILKKDDGLITALKKSFKKVIDNRTIDLTPEFAISIKGNDKNHYAFQSQPILGDANVVTGIILYFHRREYEAISNKKNAVISEDDYLKMFSHSLIAIMLTSSDGSILEINAAGCKLFGYTKSEIIKIGRRGIVDQASDSSVEKIGERAVTGQVRYELMGIKKNGLRFPLEFASVLYHTDAGEERTYTVMIDIRKRRLKKRKMDLLINNTRESFVLLDRDLTIIIFNRQMENWYKECAGQEIRVGENIMRYSKKEQLLHQEHIFSLVLRGKAKSEVSKLTNANGTEKYFTLRYHPARDEQGEIIGIFITALDITSQYNDRQEKKRIENLLNKVYSMASIGAWEVNMETGVVYWSPVVREILGVEDKFTPAIDKGLSFYPDGWPKDAISDAIDRAVKEGKTWDIELPIVTGSGTEKWVRSMGEAVFSEGRCIKIIGSLQDISEKKSAEQAAKAALLERNSILESIDDAFFAIDRNWIVTYWNNKAEKISTKKREDVIGRKLSDMFRPSRFPLNYKKYQEAFQTNRAVHFEEYFRGPHQWFEISAYPSARGLSIYFKDITDRKEKEQTIRAINERYDLVSKATNDIIWDWNIVNGEVIRTGEGLMKTFGYDVANLRSNRSFWVEHVHPDDREIVADLIEKILPNKEIAYHEGEYRFLKADGEYAYVFDKGFIVRDEYGRAVRMIGATQDISKLKKHEIALKKLNADLETNSTELLISNRELEQFAYVASHDLQEPLRMVTGFLTQLEKKYKDQLDDKANQYIYYAVDGAKRMHQIILDLLEFSRAGIGWNNAEQIDLNLLILDIIHLNQSLVDENDAEITVEKLPVIMAYKTPLIQVFQNLINNAIKYRKPGIKPLVIISASETKKCWKFAVRDNGLGIDKEYFDRIFIIFQRLHGRKEYAGTGMGLAITKKIVENLGGKIWVESETGKGSVFNFTVAKNILKTGPQMDENFEKD